MSQCLAKDRNNTICSRHRFYCINNISSRRN